MAGPEQPREVLLSGDRGCMFAMSFEWGRGMYLRHVMNLAECLVLLAYITFTVCCCGGMC